MKPDAFTFQALSTLPLAPGAAWTMLLPAGKASPRDGRGPFIVGGRAEMEAILDRTRRYHGGTDIVVDYDHQSVFAAKQGAGGTARASGWIKELEIREDGIYGRIEWTAAAAAAIKAGEYRYLSPVIPHTKAGRVVMILNAALTNSPALEMEAVAASAALPNAAVLNALMQVEKAPMDPNETDPARKLAAMLGMPADSAADAVQARLAEIMALAKALPSMASIATMSAEPDPAAYVPMAVFQATAAELNRTRQGVTKEAAERHVDKHITTGRLAPFMREWAVGLCTSNMPAFDAFAAKVGPAFTSIVQSQFKGGIPDTGGHAGALTAEETAVCSTLGIAPESYLKTRKAGQAAGA